MNKDDWQAFKDVCKVIILMSVLLFMFTCSYRTITAPMNSAVGVVEKTLDPNNVIHSYEWFFDVNEKIKARVSQIAAHNEIIKSTTNQDELINLRIEQVGMKQSCREMIAQYNANSSKANVVLFKSNSLPTVQDPIICE